MYSFTEENNNEDGLVDRVVASVTAEQGVSGSIAGLSKETF